jgi:hypothetical protein
VRPRSGTNSSTSWRDRPPTAGEDTKQRAIVRTLVNQAIAGNLRAMSVLVAVLARTQDRKDEPVEELSDHDREILEHFAQREGTAEESEGADTSSGHVPPVSRGQS